MIDSIIHQFVETPSPELQQLYEALVHQTEYNLLIEANSFPFKSQEWFDKRREAFAFRRECAKRMINAWVKKHETSQGCFITYAETLNIPFQTIKQLQH